MPLLLFALLAATPVDQPAPILTLAEAQRLVREQNLDLQVARERLEKSANLSRKAWAALLPFVSANASYTRNDKRIIIPFGLPEGLRPLFDSFGLEFPPPTNIGIQRLYQRNAAVSFSWVLLSAPAVTGILNAGDAVELARLGYAQTELALQFATALAYFSALNADQQVSIRERALTLAAEHLRMAEAKVAVGEATQVIALRSEVEVANAEQALITARNAARNAHVALATLIGYVHADGSFAPFAVERPQEAPTPPAGQDALAEALAERLDLKLLDRQLALAERQKTETWLKFLPALVATGNWRWADVKGFGGENTNWAVSLVLQWSLVEGGMRLWELDERQHEVNAAGLQLEKAREDIASQVSEAKLNLDSARATATASDRTVELARKSAALVQAQYEVGAATQLDVLDANRLLADAETAQALAALAVDIAGLSLENALRLPPLGSVSGAPAAGGGGAPAASARASAPAMSASGGMW